MDISDARMAVVSTGNPSGGSCNKKYILINCGWMREIISDGNILSNMNLF